MKTLAELYAESPEPRSDKGTIHSYIEVYEAILAPYRDNALRVLEIGILGGASLRLWERYFATKHVYGVDLNAHPIDLYDLQPMIDEGTHNIVLTDATNPANIEAHFSGMTFDVIIEDASHALEHQFAIYENLKSRLSPTGIYIIEDVADIDAHRARFEKIDPARTVTILDLRPLKDRFDDVLVVIGGR